MTKNQDGYQQLGGKGRSFFGYYRLYLGPDHLLSVTSNYLSEDYHRFYYNDIQALLAKKTLSGLIQNSLYGLLFIIFLVPLVWVGGAWAVCFAATAAIFLIALSINCLRGPTCIAHIVTPVQTVRLYSLNRVKILNRAMNRLRPLTEEVQGSLSREALSKIDPGEKPQSSLSPPLVSLKHETGAYHKLLFGLMLIYTLFILLEIFHKTAVLSLLSTSMIMFATVLLVMALVRQAGSDLHRTIKIITWATIPYICLIFIADYIMFFYVTIKNQNIGYNQWELVKKFSTLSPVEYPLLMGYFILSLCLSFLLGILGLMLTLQFQKAGKNALLARTAGTPLNAESDHE